MSTATSLCPFCGAAVAAGAAACLECGSDLALAALIAERGVMNRARGGTRPLQPTSLEQLVPRLGDFLVKHGYVTTAQLESALQHQAAPEAGQPRPLLGQTLVSMGIITHAQLDQAVARQLVELQAALLAANRTLEQRVTERTAELGAALAKLQELNQLKSNFISNISHELRTPLAQIKGYVDLLAEATLGPLSDDQSQALGTTQKAIERLERLVNDLIAYASTVRGQLSLNLEAVSPGAVISQVVDKYQLRAERQQVRLTAEAPEKLPPVTADLDKLWWTIAQLVDNAIKFTPAGGQVVARASAEADAVRFSVQDSGIGIPADRLREIFEPFHQLDGSDTRRYGGTGLGLALAHRILQAHGAEPEVHSAEGQGTTISFELRPAAPKAGA